MGNMHLKAHKSFKRFHRVGVWNPTPTSKQLALGTGKVSYRVCVGGGGGLGDEYSNFVSRNVRSEFVATSLQVTVLARSFLCCYFKILYLKETGELKISKI